MGSTRKYRKWQSKNVILTFYVLGFLGHMQFFHLATWKPYYRRPQIGGKDTHLILPLRANPVNILFIPPLTYCRS